MVVHPSVPVKSVRELIALTKARPDQVLYASPGSGTGAHMAMALFNMMTGTAMVHVPYKGSVAAAVATASGETQTMIAVISALLPQIQAKRVRLIAVSSATRVTEFPEIPTLSESGVPGYELSTWFGCFLPAKTPTPILDRLGAEIRKSLGSTDVSQSLGLQFFEPWYLTPADFEKLIKADHDKFGRIIRLTGMKVE
jgi:tripartite-type tricarboxylate transporter receptor subunit TctC